MTSQVAANQTARATANPLRRHRADLTAKAPRR